MRSLNLLSKCRRVAVFVAILAAGVLPPVAGAQGPAIRTMPPKTILTDAALLENLRQQADPAILRQVRVEADKAMKAPLVSVMDKQVTPPSGNKHDYMSLAPYWWPNPATPNHLPYIRKDGEHNPEATAVHDHANLTRMEESVHALALGYFLTRDEAYARRATEQLQVWFLNPATRMNPNLSYAQAVLGVNDGRGAGILDACGFAEVVDALALLTDSSSWNASNSAALHAWFETYFNWLTTSDNGKHEAAAKNNHGSWYDVQAEAIALYLGKTEFARNLAETAKTKRIAAQIQPDGQLPAEEARTRSFHYCVFDIEALMKLATEAQTVNVYLWNYKAPEGGSIRAALDYLLPFAAKEKKWEHEDLDGVSPTALHDYLLMAAVHYNSEKYEAAALKVQSTDLKTALLQREFAAIQKAGR